MWKEELSQQKNVSEWCKKKRKKEGMKKK